MSNNDLLHLPVSLGEAIDKITILDIKLDKILDNRKIDVKKEYNLITINSVPNDKFDALVLGVAHAEFLKLNFAELQNENSLIYDVKGVLGTIADNRL